MQCKKKAALGLEPPEPEPELPAACVSGSSKFAQQGREMILLSAGAGGDLLSNGELQNEAAAEAAALAGRSRKVLGSHLLVCHALIWRNNRQSVHW
jgi:hypothetical protein